MKRLSVRRTTWMEYRDTLRELEPFDTHGSLRGDRDTFSVGRMPDPWRSEYDERRPFIDYTVLSYATPIAWHDKERGWILPDARYSVTTSRQQSRINPAVAALIEEGN